MNPVEMLLAKLSEAKRSGSGWSARCPAHDDGKASLSVSEGDDRRALGELVEDRGRGALPRHRPSPAGRSQ